MSKATKAGHTAPPLKAPRRLNLRALILLTAVPVVGIPAFFAVKHFQNRRSMPSYLDAARQASDKGQVDIALSYVNAYLQGNPKSVDALELKGRILGDAARDYPTVQEAIRIQTQVLALDPARMDTRKRLIELNLKAGHFRAAAGGLQEVSRARGRRRRGASPDGPGPRGCRLPR